MEPNFEHHEHLECLEESLKGKTVIVIGAGSLRVAHTLNEDKVELVEISPEISIPKLPKPEPLIAELYKVNVSLSGKESRRERRKLKRNKLKKNETKRNN